MSYKLIFKLLIKILKVKQRENECKSLSLKYVQVQRRYKELSIKRNGLSDHLAFTIQNSKNREILIDSIKQEIKTLQSKLDNFNNSSDKVTLIYIIYCHN